MAYDIKKPEKVYKPTTYTDELGAYASDIAKARLALDQATGNKPADYQSQYAGQMNSLVNQLGNRKFDYDVNSDALFQQLKSLYNEQGKLAMADTQGKAASLTGGYGNSYGVTASQQAYQQTQNQLGNIIPELYQLAMARYQQEGNDLQTMYSMLASQEAADYGRYRDTVGDYENERAYRESALNNLRSMNQNLWSQNESNAYNANNQEWNNFWKAEQMAEDQRQFDAQMAYKYSNDNSAAQIAALQAKIAEMESDQRISKFAERLMSEDDFNNSRLSNRYGSWKKYIEAKIDANKELTPSERMALIARYELY